MGLFKSKEEKQKIKEEKAKAKEAKRQNKAQLKEAKKNKKAAFENHLSSMKELRDKFYHLQVNYITGVQGWSNRGTVQLIADTENNTLQIHWVIEPKEASIPFNRIEEISMVTEKDISENKDMSTMLKAVTTATNLGAAGTVVRTKQNNIGVTGVNVFLVINYKSKDGEDKTIIFEPCVNDLVRMNQIRDFETYMNPLIHQESNGIHSIEL